MGSQAESDSLDRIANHHLVGSDNVNFERKASINKGQ